jgi:hypothetical protein
VSNELSIKDMLTRFHYVTDQGANIKGALKSNYHRISCSCHSISTALKHALPGGPGDKGDTAELQIFKTAIDIGEVCTKKSGLNATLSKSLARK